MKSFSIRILAVCLVAFGAGLAGAGAHAQQSGAHTAGQLVERLRQGGYILYVRHAVTDHSQSDRDLSDLSQCDLQRNLSAQGIRESKVMGAAIAALAIKIDRVYTSPYCRCVDTAKIVFDDYQIVQELRATFFTNQKETELLAGYLKSQLSKEPATGHNIVLVGHTSNLRDLTRVWPKPEGVTHVFKPLGDGRGYEHLGRILPTEWGQLAGFK
ncbi:MAG: histidine phosphatase family protein [Rhodospirillales bacterium]|nr:histidine phosphatase family protein [Rhodospirillales bacterium]